ncbi:MAG: SGNH/GDSL hydrolase family protein [Myxococcales bacterium]|nr:SGNH/GDSL hydrolase family protein [Myxococcales bacterium]
MTGLVWTTMAMAGPQPVVAVGDSLLAAPAEAVAPAEPALPGGWVPVLADCLEERKANGFTVVDRRTPGETPSSLLSRAEAVLELQPAWVVVTLGARELASDRVSQMRPGMEAMLRALAGVGKKGRPHVLLVAMVPPTLSQTALELSEQTALDRRTEAYNRLQADVAASHRAATLVDLWSDWPRTAAARARLTSSGFTLSDEGHARVAAAICDAVMTDSGTQPR